MSAWRRKISLHAARTEPAIDLKNTPVEPSRLHQLSKIGRRVYLLLVHD